VEAILWLVFLILAGCGLGRVARGLWRGKDEPFLDRFVLDVSMGLGMMSLVLFAMAAGHVLSGPGLGISRVRLFALVNALALFLGAPLVLRDGVVSLMGWLRRKKWPSLVTVIWVVLFTCLALVVLIPALAPPSGSDWDSLAYHLAIPKLYLQHHGFYYIDFASHANFPFLVEMLYTPALAASFPSGWAKLVHYLYGMLLVLAVVMLTRRHFTAKAAPLAALAIAGMPLVMWEATTAYIDLATALYTVSAVYLLLEYFDKAELRSLIGCGVAAGLAASTKMTGLTLIPILGIWLLIDRWAVVAVLRRRHAGIEAGSETGHYGRVFGHSLIFAGFALLVCSPWYIKTLIYTGNPVYPFFYSVFGGRDWTAELARNYSALQAHFGVGHDLASFLMLPFDLTFHSEKFYDTPGLFVGPILLVALPLLYFARYQSRKLLGLTLFFLAQIVVWFALTQQSRYLIPSFALLAVIIAAIAYSDERFKLTRIALYFVFAATALFGVMTLVPLIRIAEPVVFGHETQDAYLSRTLPIYPAEKWINRKTPDDAKIALFGDTRGFYLDRDYVWADPGHNVRFTRDFASVDDFVAYLKGQGITHAMINFRLFPRRIGSRGTAALVYKAIDEGRFERVYGDEASPAAVYKIR
jgi:hypothetical protein